MALSILGVLRTLVIIIFSFFESVFRLVVPRAKKDVTGKLVLVTGAGRGIGREIALTFAKHGAKLALWDIDLDSCQEAAAEIRESGHEAHAYQSDVSKIDDVKKTAAEVRRNQGDVDILVNNAGIMNCKPLLELSEDEIWRTMNINTMAHFWTLREFLPAMMKKNEGHVVTISSVSGKFGSAYLADYTASKYAVVGLSEATRKEMLREGYTGIRFTQICPFFCNTNLIKDISHRVSWSIGLEKRELDASDVAVATVDGTLRDEPVVYVPGNFSFLHKVDAFVPQRGVQAMEDLICTGFFQKTKSQ